MNQQNKKETNATSGSSEGLSLKELQSITNLFSKRAGQADEFMQALQTLSVASKNRDVLKQLITSLAKLNQTQAKAQDGAKTKPVSGSSTSKSTQNLDPFFNMVSTPGLRQLVSDVMKNRRSKI
ncbi:hypothetical protein IC620_01430 [Hazenella sp. IB182357]|uniref:Uncharacterized protein n=1 Tax=Polycladospora coralii TaxID=2771432 RepID=A0A926N5M1_9BACL|nr:hypothetical protein [Polycladospora coralii]MBD1371021.1 hypothetical protein [Polycladospora coralii]MBS7529961.1 hypothetical protein [Polycladospora coralii]